jgi:opacity protein-like surface antigen
MRVLLGAALAACLLIISTVAANATDPNWLLPSPSKPGEAWVHNRTASYVGVVGGYNAAALQADDFKFGETAWLGGAFAGVNVRVNEGLMLGLEADYVLTDIKASTTDGEVHVIAKTKYLASLRARAGLPAGPALLYVTAGPAITEQSVAIPEVGLAASELKVGLVAGAGVDMSLTKNLFVRLEGLHYVFPDKDIGFLESKDQQTTLRLGVGFKLN